MTFKRFLASTAIATIASAFPVAALANNCPEPPPGMEWKSGFPGDTSVSINGKPYVMCNIEAFRGGGSYICPTFTVSFANYKFNTVWDVTDKNNNKFVIYDNSGDYNNIMPKPKREEIINVIPKGCEIIRTEEVTSPAITVITRHRRVQTLVKKPVPTF